MDLKNQQTIKGKLNAIASKLDNIISSQRSIMLELKYPEPTAGCSTGATTQVTPLSNLLILIDEILCLAERADNLSLENYKNIVE